MEPKVKKPWLDFAHTVEVMTARALAQYDRQKASKPTSAAAVVSFESRARKGGADKAMRFVSRFELERLAAASAEVLGLKKGELCTRDGTIVGKFACTDGHFHLSLQLKGYALLSAYGGREARLTCFNGVQSESFRFDERGSADIDLPDDAATQEGLGRVTLEFAED